MKKHLLLIAALAAVAGFTSCNDDDDPIEPVLELDPSEISVLAETKDYTVQLNSNTAWEVYSTSSNVASVSPSNGEGDATVRFSLEENTGALRTETITFRTTGGLTISAVLKITQFAEGVPLEGLSLSEDEVEIAFDGGTAEVSVLTVESWTATAPEGVTVSPASGNGPTQVKLTIDEENDGEADIDYTVIFKDGSGKEYPLTVVHQSPRLVYGEVTYSIVKLADNRWWMAENLRYVPEGETVSTDPTDDSNIWYAPGIYRTADNVLQAQTHPDSVIKYGLSYSGWFALGLDPDAIDADNYQQYDGLQGICPDGWHIPTQAEMNGIAGAGSPYYDTAQSGALISTLEEAGFPYIVSGSRQQNTTASVRQYNVACNVLGSTLSRYTVNDSGAVTAHSYQLMWTNAATYQRVTVMSLSIYSGISVRCIKDL